MMGFNNIELISDRPIEVNFREIYEVKKRYPAKSGDRFADGRIQARILARDGAPRRRRRLRRAGTEFRLSARHERARHGLGRRPGARIHGNDHVVGEGSGQDAGDRQAHAQRHRHYAHRRGGRTRRRGRRQPDQHHQFADGRGPGDVRAAAQRGRQILARRLLRARR